MLVSASRFLQLPFVREPLSRRPVLTLSPGCASAAAMAFLLIASAATDLLSNGDQPDSGRGLCNKPYPTHAAGSENYRDHTIGRPLSPGLGLGAGKRRTTGSETNRFDGKRSGRFAHRSCLYGTRLGGKGTTLGLLVGIATGFSAVTMASSRRSSACRALPLVRSSPQRSSLAACRCRRAAAKSASMLRLQHRKRLPGRLASWPPVAPTTRRSPVDRCIDLLRLP